ncbi:MAG: structural protein P5, partial [Alphaproteobacteria bacterium]
HTYTTAKALVEAIITKENGVQPYSDAEIDDGLRLAGIEPPPRPLAESRTIQGSTVAVGGAAVALVTEAVRAAEPAIPLIQQIVTVAPWAVSVLILAGAAYAAYARYDDWRSARR